jgi:hypothetical protein
MHQKQATQEPATAENDADDLSIDMSEVSDAETLLACRAYLQRRNKLGWKESGQRKFLRQQASAMFPSFAKESVGHFWEDPSELLFLNDTDNKNNENGGGDQPSYGDVYKEEPDEVLQQPHADQVIFEETDDGDESVYRGGDVFTTYPSGPSAERIRRSEAKSAQWQDPAFREQWYGKRWGGRTILTESLKQERLLGKRVLNIPADILESEEMAALTDEEINDAIRTYVLSKRRRSRAMKSTTKQYVELKNDKRIPRDALFSFDEKAMNERKQIRAERAKAAYQKRLDNQRLSPILPKQSRTFVPRGMSPKEALLRVSADLDLQQLPTIQDVAVMLLPQKLGRRKDLLRRILNEHFDLRGKCVPDDFDEPNGACHFVTQVPIDHLGKFVIMQMEKDASVG